MPDEKKFAEQINTYAELAREDKNINASALMLSALKTGEQNLVSERAKRWAYLISIGVPPVGLLIALKYYLSEEDDARSVANTCVALTVVAVGMVWLFGKLFFSSANVSVESIEKIQPSDVRDLYE